MTWCLLFFKYTSLTLIPNVYSMFFRDSVPQNINNPRCTNLRSSATLFSTEKYGLTLLCRVPTAAGKSRLIFHQMFIKP